MLHEQMVRDGEKPIAIRQELPSEMAGISRLELIKQGRRLAAEAVENADGSIVSAYTELAKRDVPAAIRHVAADIAGAAASNLQEAL